MGYIKYAAGEDLKVIEEYFKPGQLPDLCGIHLFVNVLHYIAC